MKTLSKLTLLSAAIGMALLAGTASAKTLRFSHLGKPGSDIDLFAQEFAERAAEVTDGRVEVDVYPASQLGDWTEVQGHVMQGAVDFALQPLSTQFDQSAALAWFPYAVTSYDEAREAFSEGGYINELMNDSSQKLGLKILGGFGLGMGGAGFTKAVPSPADPNVDKGLKVRIWPGGTTHRVWLEHYGYQTAPIAWAELYTSLQTGVVDGAVGGTATNQVESFEDVTDTWVQYNDHYELGWIITNAMMFDSLSQEDQKALQNIINELSAKRFDTVAATDQQKMDELREKGVNVVTFTPEEMAAMAAEVREQVWPQIKDELGDEVYGKLKEKVGM